jgi:hypothetical protein
VLNALSTSGRLSVSTATRSTISTTTWLMR